MYFVFFIVDGYNTIGGNTALDLHHEAVGSVEIRKPADLFGFREETLLRRQSVQGEYNGIIRTLFRYYPDRGTELSGRLTGIIRIKFRNYSDGIMILSGFRSGIIRTN